MPGVWFLEVLNGVFAIVISGYKCKKASSSVGGIRDFACPQTKSPTNFDHITFFIRFPC